MITRIEAYRYRCFEKLGLNLGAYQVLVGANGAGKSTLLDIPVLLGECLGTRSVHDTLFKSTPSHDHPRADAPQDLVFNRAGEWFAFAVEARLPELLVDQWQRQAVEKMRATERRRLEKNPGTRVGSVRYELGCRIVAGTLEISHEFLFLLPENRALIGEKPDGLWGEFAVREGGAVRTVLRRSIDGGVVLSPEVPSRIEDLPTTVPAVAPALAGVPLDVNIFAACNWFRQLLATGALRIALNLPAMRSAQLPPGRDSGIAGDGTTLPWSVMAIAKQPELLEEWVMHVQGALPMIRNIGARTREDDGLAYLVVDYGQDLEVKSAGLSDGTLSILALSILPFLSNVPAIVLVEEPENGIHPKAIETILESLSQLKQSQVLITTHSPVAVAATPPNQLLCLRQVPQRGVQVTRGDEHPRLLEWKGTPSLATLFSAGVL